MRWTGKASVLAISLLVVPALGSAETRRQYSGTVSVGGDGNGAFAATFPTALGGPPLHSFLTISQGATSVTSLVVTLNADVVFQSDAFTEEVVEVALNAVGVTNQLSVAALGPPGSSATVGIVATRPTAHFGGVAVLPIGWTGSPLLKMFLVANNVGPDPLVLRVTYYQPDGTLLGRSAPRPLAPLASTVIDPASVASQLGIDWTLGPVRLEWVSVGPTRLSAVCMVARRSPGADGSLEIIDVQPWTLDHFGPAPITRARYDEIATP